VRRAPGDAAARMTACPDRSRTKPVHPRDGHARRSHSDGASKRAETAARAPVVRAMRSDNG